MEKCIVCGKLAPVPPFCLNCMLGMEDDEYRARRAVWALTALDEENGQMAHECSMCGQYCASVDKNGHCSHCRQVWDS